MVDYVLRKHILWLPAWSI